MEKLPKFNLLCQKNTHKAVTYDKNPWPAFGILGYNFVRFLLFEFFFHLNSEKVLIDAQAIKLYIQFFSNCLYPTKL